MPQSQPEVIMCFLVSSVSVLGARDDCQNLLLRGIRPDSTLEGKIEGASSPQDLFQGFLPALPV